MKSKKFEIKKEYGNLRSVLENEISVFMLFVFHGNENFVFPEIFPFEYPEPETGGIKEDGFAPSGHLHDFTPKRMKEILEESELEVKASDEAIVKAINTLERAGYIEEIGMSFGKNERRYIATEKGYNFANFLGYSMHYPGRTKKEKIYPQY